MWSIVDVAYARCLYDGGHFQLEFGVGQDRQGQRKKTGGSHLTVR